MGLVLSLVLAANFFIAKEKERVRRIKLETDLVIVIDSKRRVENRLANELKEKDILQKELDAEKKWSNSLESQLKEREREINFVL
ncbi:MAG: hypothetical protein KJ706_08715, partial [Candidatus Omnitrophica bacterium]|nr:hypothetical protein [Candidatus Omnitrophota bacterium]